MKVFVWVLLVAYLIDMGLRYEEYRQELMGLNKAWISLQTVEIISSLEKGLEMDILKSEERIMMTMDDRCMAYRYFVYFQIKLYALHQCTTVLLHNMLFMVFRVTPMSVSFSESYLISDLKLVLL